MGFYEAGFNDGIYRDFRTLLPDGKVQRMSMVERGTPCIVHVQFSAAQWNLTDENVPSIAVTPKLVKVRHKGALDPKLEVIVLGAARAGIHVDIGAFDVREDYNDFYEWEPS